MEKLAGENGGRQHEKRREENERQQARKQTVLQEGAEITLHIVPAGDIPGEHEKKHHVEGVDELVLRCRRRVFKVHDALNEMPVKDQGHGQQAGHIDEQYARV